MSSQTGNGPLTEYTYDLAGNVLTKRVGGAGAAGATTTFTYNNRGQLTQTTDALGQVETFTYDANGLLLTRTDRNGMSFHNTYDHMGRLVREEAMQGIWARGHRTSSFTATGAVRTISNGSHSIHHYYDAQGRLHIQSETGRTTGSVTRYYYNTANNLTAVLVYTDWWGPTRTRQIHTTHTYDVAQRIHTTTTNGELLVTYAYDANSRRIRSTYSNGTVTDYTRNLAGMVTNLVNRRGITVLSSFAYIYYLDGNTHRVTETMDGVTRVVTYTYDTARRLINEHDTGAGTVNRAYTFDARGNRASMTVSGAENYTVTYGYDRNNRLLYTVRTGTNPSTTTFTYDRNGNQTWSTTTGDPQTGTQYELRDHNAFNQLVFTDRTTMPYEPIEEYPGYSWFPWQRVEHAFYYYRADGLRAGITRTILTPNATEFIANGYVWDRGNIVLQTNQVGGVVNRYLRGVRGQLIRSDHHGWYLHDARGSVVQRTNAQGNVMHTYRYTAFGNEINYDSYNHVLNPNPFRFNGMYWDAHRGEYMTPNRMFNPRLGRWTQPDPFWDIHNMMENVNTRTQAGNLYMFTMHNPVRWADPTGLFAKPAMSVLSVRSSFPVPKVITHSILSSSLVACSSSSFSVSAVQNAMAAGANLLVFVGGMTAFGPQSNSRLPQHASIQIFIAPGHELWDTGHFDSIGGGIGHATIGGFTANRYFSGIRGALGEIGEPMVGFINDGFDVYLPALHSLTHLPGVTTAQVESMFLAALNFTNRGAIPYNPIGVGGHNSNSFIAGLLNHAQVRHPSVSNSAIGGFPGWNNPIPSRYFRPIPPREVSPGILDI